MITTLRSSNFAYLKALNIISLGGYIVWLEYSVYRNLNRLLKVELSKCLERAGFQSPSPSVNVSKSFIGSPKARSRLNYSMRFGISFF